MISIQPILDRKVITEFLTQNDIPNLSFSDEDLKEVLDGNWEFGQNMCLGGYKDEELILIIKLDELSNTTVGWHGYLLPKYWGTGISDVLNETAVNWLTKHTDFLTVVIETPEDCKEVLKASVRWGFELIGVIPLGVRWRGRAQNLVLLQRILKVEK